MGQTYEAVLSVQDKASGPITEIQKALGQLSASAAKAQKALTETEIKNPVEMPVNVSQNLKMMPHQRLWMNLQKQVRGSSEDVEELGKRVSEVNSHFGEFGTTLSEVFPMLGGLGAAGSFAGLFELANKFAENTEALDLASQKIGVTTGELQKLDYAAKMTGLDTGTFNDGLVKLDKNLGAAATGGNKKFADLLKKLHVSLIDSKGAVIDGAQALPALEKAFYATHDAAMKAYIAQLAFGKSGADMIPFLNEGPEKINELQSEFAALGYTPTTADKLNAAEFTDSWKKLQTAVGGFTDELGAKLDPVLTPIVSAMTDWVTQNRGWVSSGIASAIHDAATEFTAWLKSMGGVKGINADLKTLGDEFQTIYGDIGGASTIAEAFGAYMGIKFIAQLRDAGAAMKIFTGIMLDNPILASLAAIAVVSLEIYDHWSDITGAIQSAISRFEAFQKLTPKQQADKAARDNSRTAGYYSRNGWHASPVSPPRDEHVNRRLLPNPVQADLRQLAQLRDTPPGPERSDLHGLSLRIIGASQAPVKGAVDVTVTINGAPAGSTVAARSSGVGLSAPKMNVGRNGTIRNHRSFSDDG